MCFNIQYTSKVRVLTNNTVIYHLYQHIEYKRNNQTKTSTHKTERD